MNDASVMYVMSQISRMNVHRFVPGPIPIFFSEKPAESLKELKETPEYAFQCLQQLVSKLYVRGELSR